MRDQPTALADSAGCPTPAPPDGLTEDQPDAIIGDLVQRRVHNLRGGEQPDQRPDGVVEGVVGL